MGRFIFYFASQAYYSEKRDAFPAKGVQVYGDLAHKYNIPVTWFTNAEGARRGKDIFTKFHEEFGDDVFLWGNPSTKGNTAHMRETVLKMTQEEIESYIIAEQDGVKKILPFAQVDHIGWFYRTLPAVRAMEKLGIKSCYGHCWELIATDGVTDNGVPWGFYYMDSETCWKRPKQVASKKAIVANEWLQHDLNKSWNYFGSCSVFSFDPNDVERAKICDGRQIEYWKAAFREYYMNKEWNDFIPFVLHQEAHEQESTPGGWEVYDQATVDNTYEMTDEFLKFITSGEFLEMEIMSLKSATEEYRKQSDLITPTYMLYKDIEINSPIWNERLEEVREIYQEAKEAEEEEGDTLEIEKDYKKMNYVGFPHYGWQGMLYEEKFPDSFVYCDADVQLFFHRGKLVPIKLWNYHKPVDPDPKNLYFNQYLYQQDKLPQYCMMGGQIILDSDQSLPYGICLWEDFSKNNIELSIEHDAIAEEFTSKIVSYKKISNQLLFIRLDLKPGECVIKINRK